MAKLTYKWNALLASFIAIFGFSTNIQAQQEVASEEGAPKAAGEEAAEKASGSLSAGAIAAAVAAAAAIGFHLRLLRPQSRYSLL